jgi:hypothetical protein
LASILIGKGRKKEPDFKETNNNTKVGSKIPWTKCLPIVLLCIRTVPRKDIGLSPYEMLYGLPYLGKCLSYYGNKGSIP